MHSSHDYRETHIKTCEKLIRQRVYYINLAKTWESSSLRQTLPPSEADFLRIKIDFAMKVASDLKFIIDRSMRGLPVADLERIQSLSDGTKQAA